MLNLTLITLECVNVMMLLQLAEGRTGTIEIPFTDYHTPTQPTSPRTKKLRAATCAKLNVTSLGPFRHSCTRDTLLGRDTEIISRAGR